MVVIADLQAMGGSIRGSLAVELRSRLDGVGRCEALLNFGGQPVMIASWPRRSASSITLSLLSPIGSAPWQVGALRLSSWKSLAAFSAE